MNAAVYGTGKISAKSKQSLFKRSPGSVTELRNDPIDQSHPRKIARKGAFTSASKI
jgi:hypothetical protein